jgi:hypothetical protein
MINLTDIPYVLLTTVMNGPEFSDYKKAADSIILDPIKRRSLNKNSTE